MPGSLIVKKYKAQTFVVKVLNDGSNTMAVDSPRITHAWYVKGVRPLELAARGKGGHSTRSRRQSCSVRRLARHVVVVARGWRTPHWSNSAWNIQTQRVRGTRIQLFVITFQRATLPCESSPSRSIRNCASP